MAATSRNKPGRRQTWYNTMVSDRPFRSTRQGIEGRHLSGQIDEYAFETQVEQTLLGPAGWRRGDLAEWDGETQPKLWADMRTLHGSGLETLLTEAVAKELDLKGALHVLRHGFKFFGRTFRLAYFKPAHGLNDEVLRLCAQNRLTVTRQVRCHPGKNDTVDLVLAVNGLPVATCELKNPATGQSWRHAVKQYQDSRDPPPTRTKSI
jgi:type I restriction enzyme R subunit